MDAFRIQALRFIGQLLLAGKKSVATLRKRIPTHIQSLIWFQVAADGSHQSRTLFEMGCPNCFWMTQWDEVGDDSEFPKSGYFLWCIWDNSIGARRYIALCASEFKDIFYDYKNLNDLFSIQDRAILKRLRTFTYMDSIIHLKDHKLMDMVYLWSEAEGHGGAEAVCDRQAKGEPVCDRQAKGEAEPQKMKRVAVLKTLVSHGLEESLYIPKNLTAAAILWIYFHLRGELGDELPAATVVLTDYELEERYVLLNEPVFE